MTTLPEFEVSLVSADNGEFCERTVSLPALIAEKNQGLVLYFYPKDNTAGCTVQATEFSTHLQDFINKGYFVIGVSRDSTKSHQNFIQKHNLSIALISDPDEKLCHHFDVIKEKMMYGKTHLGVVRSTFVFDKHGALVHEYRNVKAKTHQNELLGAL